MYLIYSRYLFLTIFRSFYLVFSLIVGVLWLAQILRYYYFYTLIFYQLDISHFGDGAVIEKTLSFIL
jgi:hypothetical protein